MSMADKIAKGNPLVEKIACAIFEKRYRGRSWEIAKVSDQWLALGAWEEAIAVFSILPLGIDHPPQNKAYGTECIVCHKTVSTNDSEGVQEIIKVGSDDPSHLVHYACGRTLLAAKNTEWELL